MSTQWRDLDRFEPRTFLLANGKTVREPALEETSTGRKVRVKGTTQSYYSGDIDKLIGTAVQEVAKAEGTTILADLTDSETRWNNVLGFNPATTPARLHLAHDTENSSGQTVCWWKFRHPDMPYEVILAVDALRLTGWHEQGQHRLTARLVMPVVDHDGTFDSRLVECQSQRLEGVLEALNGTLHDTWYAWLRDNPQPWAKNLGIKNTTSPRGVITQLHHLVHEYEDLESITVPDFRDIENPSVMELEIYDTNVNPELLADLAEYLDGQPIVEKVIETYKLLIQQLGLLGVQVPETLTENDFLSAGVSGDGGKLHIQVQNPLDETGKDSAHQVSIHLPTGTFMVTCTATRADRNEAAEKWEEVQMVAELTGNEPQLLAFARLYALDKDKNRIERIITSRKGEL